MRQLFSKNRFGLKSRIIAALVFIGLCVVISGCFEPAELPEDYRKERARSDIEAVFPDKPLFDKPLALEEVIDHALANNLDAAIAAQKELINLESSTGARRKMLPTLMLVGEESGRSKVDASSSKTLVERTVSEDPSYSDQKRTRTVNLALTWNLIDFGLSYFRARQEDQRIGIARQRLRRLRQNLAMEVTQAYWRVQVARRSMDMSREILAKIEERKNTARQQLKEKITSKRHALETESKLFETQMRLRRYQREYRSAKTQLASLMGLPVGVPFFLEKHDFDAPLQVFDLDYRSLEDQALLNRPEMFEQDCQELIAADEVRLTLVQMFPNAQLFARKDYDHNRFLYYNDWYSIGLNASLDLLSFPQKQSRRRQAKMQEEMVRKQRTAMAIGVLAQVRIAGIEYEDNVEEYKLLRALSRNKRQYLEELKKAKDEGEEIGGELALIMSERDAILAETQMLDSYSRVMASGERLRNSVGADHLADKNPADGMEKAEILIASELEKPLLAGSEKAEEKRAGEIESGSISEKDTVKSSPVVVVNEDKKEQAEENAEAAVEKRIGEKPTEKAKVAEEEVKTIEKIPARPGTADAPPPPPVVEDKKEPQPEPTAERETSEKPDADVIDIRISEADAVKPLPVKPAVEVPQKPEPVKSETAADEAVLEVPEKPGDVKPAEEPAKAEDFKDDSKIEIVPGKPVSRKPVAADEPDVLISEKDLVRSAAVKFAEVPSTTVSESKTETPKAKTQARVDDGFEKTISAADAVKSAPVKPVPQNSEVSENATGVEEVTKSGATHNEELPVDPSDKVRPEKVLKPNDILPFIPVMPADRVSSEKIVSSKAETSLNL